MDKRFFLGCTTYKGFYGFYDKIIEYYDLQKLYILKGGSGVGKSTFMKKFAAQFKGEDIDYIHCANDPDTIDGVVIIGRKIGMVDGTAPHTIDVKYPGVIDETIDLGKFIIPAKVKADKAAIDRINRLKQKHYKNAQRSLLLARRAHIRIEEFYRGAVDFEKMKKVLPPKC